MSATRAPASWCTSSVTPLPDKTQRGFTLLEIMVATAILGIILTTVYGVLSRALYAKNHAEERADLYASGREKVLQMADELEGALPPTAGRNIGFIGAPGTERVPADTVQFDVVIRRPFSSGPARGGRALVSYSLDPVKETPNLYALLRQEQLLTNPMSESGTDDNAGSGDPAQPTVTATHLIDQVAGLRFRYVDQTGQFVDSWDTTIARPGQQGLPGLPGAVEITLFLADNQGGVHDFTTIVDLPLANLVPTPGR
jgi:prepilin-type N-terminal cleavage/methylation domain-containing protein